MNRGKIHRRLTQRRTSAQRNILCLITLRKVSAPIHSKIDDLVERRKRLVLSGEDKMCIRLHHPTNILLLGELQIAGSKAKVAITLGN